MCDIPEDSHHHYGALASSPLHSNQSVYSGMHIGTSNNSLSSGEHVLKILFADFVYLSGKKIERVMKEPHDTKIADTLQLGGDEVFDQLLASLRSVAEFCLPSILTTLFKWHQVELGQTGGEETNGERTWSLERRELVVNFIFCLAVIEVLKMLHLHPAPDSQVATILNMAFSYFRCLDPLSPSGGAQLSASMGTGPSSSPPVLANVRKVADLFAEMLGVLSQACYVPVHRRFLAELQLHTSSPDMAINTIRGMSLLRVKMFPVEEVEAWFQFLQRCAEFLTEVRDPRIKNSMAYTLVEILIPVSIVIRLEVSLPPVKKFVDQLFSYSLELLSRKKDRYTVTVFPLLTMLLSVSQSHFFILNWHPFLTLCLNNLRSRNSKVARIALDCVYRLVWVYVVRIKCESNTQTYSRLKQVMDCLFPKGTRGLVPKEGPLHYFVRIIHVVAREKLDFALREVVMELIACKGSKPVINPERMNIGFRAFFAIADSLERQEEDPPSPSSTIVLPSGTMTRTRRSFLTHTLTEPLARQIGLQVYLAGVKRSLGQILRHLDNSVGKPLLATNTQSLKNPEDVLSSDRKAKVELLRTCVASIPRCAPDGYSTEELVEFLSRCTIHCDHDLNVFAFAALQSLQEHNPAIRPDIIKGVVNFILREVPDSCPLILDMGIRMLIVLLTHWRELLSSPPPQDKNKSKYVSSSSQADLLALRQVEALGLVLICANRQLTRKKTFELLKEALQVSLVIPAAKDEESVYSLIDKAGPELTQLYLSQLEPEERHSVRGVLINIEWLSEKLSQKGVPEEAWTHCLASLFSSDLLPTHCPSAVSLCWPLLSNRLLSLYSAMYPRFNAVLPLPSVSGSTIRSKKFLDPQDVSLFQNYLLVACSIVPGLSPPLPAPLAPHARQQTRESLTDSVSSQGSFTCESPPPSSEVVMTSHDLFHWIIPMIRSEAIEMQRSVVYALGKIHPGAFLSFLEELQPVLKEAGDKNETVRRRKRRSGMRIELARILEMNASLRCFTLSPLSSRPDLLTLLSCYLENTRILLLLEAESDRMHKWKYSIKSHFGSLVALLYWEIGEGRWNEEAWSVLCSYDLRSQLYTFFTSSCGLPRLTEGDCSPARKYPSLEEGTSLSLTSLDAMSALACCGPLFDPAGLESDGYLISWLTSILESQVSEVQPIACRTIQSLLRHNLDSHPLLNWVLSHCYTSPSQTASDLSFSALSRVFSRVSYPCDPVSLLLLSLLKSSSPNPQTREEAVGLLQVLESRHLLKDSLPVSVGAYVARRGVILVRHFSTHHPELTIPIFSDMVYRIEGASHINKRNLLQLILPWLSNIELVDVLVLPLQDTLPLQRTQSDTSQSGLKGTGWGCHQASELVLNNLLFLTIEHSLEFPHEIEALWGSLSTWRHNVGLIYSYLLQVIGLALTPRMLYFAKSILCYLARRAAEPVISLLLKELTSVEIISGYLESISPPPYFQIRPGKHYLLSSTLTQSDTLVFQNDTILKSRYQSDLLHGIMGRSVSPPPRCDSRSASVYAAIPLSRSKSIGAGVITDPKGKLYENRALWRKSQGMDYSLEKLTGLFQPDSVSKENPLEARSSTLSPPKLSSRNSTVGTKSTWVSNTGSSLGDEIPNWIKVWCNKSKPHPLPVPSGSVFYARLTRFLQLGVLGLPLHRCNFALMLLTQVLIDQPDHSWDKDLPLLLHVLFLGFDHLQPLVSEHCKHLLVSLLVLLANRQEPSLAAQLLMLQQQLFSQSILFESTESFHSEPLLVVSDPSHDILARSRLQRAEADIQSILSQGANSKTSSAFHLVARLLSNDVFKPIWPKDDITPQNKQLASANQINSYIQQLLGILEDLKYTGVRDNWCHVSLSWALACTSRHYACRSFQICRSLNIQLNPSTTQQIVSRLVEAVADTSEDVQGYVMEILLTLSSGVEQLLKCVSATQPLPNTSELLTPIPNKPRIKRTHKRSNSSGNIDTKALSVDSRNKVPSRPVSRLSNASPSSHSISPRRESITLTTPLTPEEEQLLHVLLVSLCLLTSDFTHQYSMSLKLMSACLDGISIGSPAVESQLQTYIQSMIWDDFPGVQGLLLKGLTSSQLYEDSIKLIGRLTPYACSPLYYPTQSLGLPRNVLLLLPVFVVNFSHQDDRAKQFSSVIAQTCKETAKGEEGLDSLGTLFQMYSLKSYHQPVHMWLASVSKFLNSAYPDNVQELAGTLLDLLEEGVSLLQKPILQILGPFVKQMDQSHPNFPHFYKSLLRVVCVFLQTPLWEDCVQLLQDAVCDCSSLERPPTPVYDDQTLHLPGPIMRFTLDISHTLQREFRTQDQCKQRNSLAPGWDRCVPSCNTSQELLTRALAVMTSESQPSVSRSSSVLFNSDMDRGIAAFYASYTSPTPMESPTLKQATSPCDPGDTGSCVDVDLLLHKAFNFLDEEDFSDHDMATVESNVGLPWGVKLKKPLMDSEYAPSDHSESQEFSRYKAAQPISGRSLLDELQSWEHEQDPVDIIVPDSQDEFPTVHLSDPPLGEETPAPSEVDPWGQEGTSQVSLTRDDSTSVSDSMGEFVSSREITHPCSPDLSDSETGGYDSSCQLLPPTSHTVFLLVEREDIEDAWVNHTSDVSGDSCQAVHSFHLFNKLFKECRDVFISLTTESCNYLTEAHKGIVSKLIVVIEIIMNQWECPLVFMDQKVITGLVSVHMDKFVFYLMEIKNDFNQYNTKRRQAQESLDLLKRSLKSLHPSEEVTGSNTSIDLSPAGKLSPQALVLCRALYRMHFQFLVFLGSYNKLLGIVESWRYVDGLLDISDQLEPVSKQLSTFLSPESTPKCEGVVLEKKFMFGSPGKSRKFLHPSDLERGLKLTRVERHKSHGASKSMHQLEGRDTGGLKRNKSMSTNSYPHLPPYGSHSPPKPINCQLPEVLLHSDISSISSATQKISQSLTAGDIQEAVQTLNEARIKFPSDTLGTGPEDNMECLLLILAQSFLTGHSGVLGLTGCSQHLGEVHNDLMANNVNLYALLEHYED